MKRYFQQRLTILDMIEQIDGEDTGTQTLRSSQLDKAALFTSWTDEAPLFIRADSEYIRDSTKHLPFHAPSFYKSGKGLLH